MATITRTTPRPVRSGTTGATGSLASRPAWDGHGYDAPTWTRLLDDRPAEADDAMTTSHDAPTLDGRFDAAGDSAVSTTLGRLP